MVNAIKGICTMERIISSALATYREIQAEKSHEFYNKYTKLVKIENRNIEQTHEMHIAWHKAMQAADVAKEAHETLCGKDQLQFVIDSMLPAIFTFSQDLQDKMRDIIAPRAEEAYEYFENKVEDAALSKFHYDAFGE
jgi:predicted nicotinamide N-methyase